MTEPIWNRFLTERDKQVFAAAGYGARAGFGSRPALLVIDVNYNFCGDRREPILESIKRWRNSCGAEAWDGVARIRELIDVAHTQAVPVIYTTGVRRADNWDSGSWSWKNTRTGERPVAARTDRDDHERLRARHRARRVQQQLSCHGRRRGVLRSLAGQSRRQPVRHACEVR